MCYKYSWRPYTFTFSVSAQYAQHLLKLICLNSLHSCSFFHELYPYTEITTPHYLAKVLQFAFHIQVVSRLRTDMCLWYTTCGLISVLCQMNMSLVSFADNLFSLVSQCYLNHESNCQICKDLFQSPLLNTILLFISPFSSIRLLLLQQSCVNYWDLTVEIFHLSFFLLLINAWSLHGS